MMPRTTLAAIALSGLLVACSGPPDGVVVVENTALDQLLVDVSPVVIDVRTTAEFQAGHVPGAVHIPHENIVAGVAGLDVSNGVVLYCGRGPRAIKAEEALIAAGIDNLYHLNGGMEAWRASGLPVARP